MGKHLALWCERSIQSWWTVHVHTAWFVLWLVVLHKDINELTMWVSLEAIYLCLLLGIAQGHHERERERE